MNTRTPSPPLGELEQLGEVALALEVVEELADALELGGVGGALDQVGAAAHDQSVAAALRTAGPGGGAGLDQLARQRVELGAAPRDLGGDDAAHLAEGAALQDGVEEVRGRLHRRGGQPGRRGEKAVLDLTVGGDEHDQRAAGAEGDELDVADRRRGLRGEHQAGAVGEAREQVAGAVEDRADVALVAAEAALDLGALGPGDVADLEDAVDEEPEPELGRDAAGGDVRRVEEAEELEVLHHVADGRGRHPLGKRASEGA